MQEKIAGVNELPTRYGAKKKIFAFWGLLNDNYILTANKTSRRTRMGTMPHRDNFSRFHGIGISKKKLPVKNTT
jgi:hypothetical protein